LYTLPKISNELYESSFSKLVTVLPVKSGVWNITRIYGSPSPILFSHSSIDHDLFHFNQDSTIPMLELIDNIKLQKYIVLYNIKDIMD
jgi:hypothetical protein